MASISTATETSSEARQQKLQELRYLNPPKIESDDCKYTINSRVPTKKPFEGDRLEGMTRTCSSSIRY